MVLAPRDEHCMQRPVEIVARADAGGKHRLDGVLHGSRTDAHACLAQRTREIDDVVGDAPTGERFFGFRTRHRHRAYSAADSSAFTSLRMRRPSPSPIRSISS